MSTTESMNMRSPSGGKDDANTGRIKQVIGPTVDVECFGRLATP